ncbi:MAG: hypothetical protein MHM6MM_000687 [Cercozoa sp. M6MM]
MWRGDNAQWVVSGDLLNALQTANMTPEELDRTPELIRAACSGKTGKDQKLCFLTGVTEVALRMPQMLAALEVTEKREELRKQGVSERLRALLQNKQSRDVLMRAFQLAFDNQNAQKEKRVMPLAYSADRDGQRYRYQPAKGSHQCGQYGCCQYCCEQCDSCDSCACCDDDCCWTSCDSDDLCVDPCDPCNPVASMIEFMMQRLGSNIKSQDWKQAWLDFLNCNDADDCGEPCYPQQEPSYQQQPSYPQQQPSYHQEPSYQQQKQSYQPADKSEYIEDISAVN